MLTDFVFAESTGYLSVPTGVTHTSRPFTRQAAAPRQSPPTVNADGWHGLHCHCHRGWRQRLAAGPARTGWTTTALLQQASFKLRLGHLAPFTDTIAGTLADVRLQDGTPVITDVLFGAVAALILELPAGTYDLKITTPGGGDQH